jgi:hypothetical protein
VDGAGLADAAGPADAGGRGDPVDGVPEGLTAGVATDGPAPAVPQPPRSAATESVAMTRTPDRRHRMCADLRDASAGRAPGAPLRRRQGDPCFARSSVRRGAARVSRQMQAPVPADRQVPGRR